LFEVVIALDDFGLAGVINTAAFLRDVVASEPFARAELSTSFIDENFKHWSPDSATLEAGVLAAALVASGAFGSTAANSARSDPAVQSRPRSPWDVLRGFELWNRR